MAEYVWGDSQTEFFFQLTPDRILGAFESATGLRATGRCLSLQSMENRVFDVEVDLDDPKAVPKLERSRIIKFYRPGRWTEEQILAEHRFLWDLLDQEIPVAAPLKPDGETTLFKDASTGLFYCVFPKVGGRSPEELTSEQLEIVGRLLARMHMVGRTSPAHERIKLTPLSYGLNNLNFLLEGDHLPISLRSSFQKTVEEIIAISSPWFESTHYQRVHGDCHLGNLMWGDLGPFWVDFDDFVMGPPVQDIWLVVPGRDSTAIADRALLLEAYEMLAPFDHSSLRLIEPLRALRFIHFHAWIAKRYQDPAFQRAFADFGSERYWQSGLHDLQEQLRLISAL